MITTNQPHRIDGRDHTGDRWAAHLIPTTNTNPPLTAIRTLNGSIHLNPDDTTALYHWLRQLILNGHLDPQEDPL